MYTLYIYPIHERMKVWMKNTIHRFEFGIRATLRNLFFLKKITKNHLITKITLSFSTDSSTEHHCRTSNPLLNRIFEQFRLPWTDLLILIQELFWLNQTMTFGHNSWRCIFPNGKNFPTFGVRQSHQKSQKMDMKNGMLRIRRWRDCC